MIKNSPLGESARASLRDPILKEFWVSLLSSCEIKISSSIMVSFIDPMSENINGIKVYPLIKSKITKIIPGPLVLGVVGSMLAVFFGLNQEHYYDFLGKQFFITSKYT